MKESRDGDFLPAADSVLVMNLTEKYLYFLIAHINFPISAILLQPKAEIEYYPYLISSLESQGALCQPRRASCALFPIFHEFCHFKPLSEGCEESWVRSVMLPSPTWDFRHSTKLTEVLLYFNLFYFPLKSAVDRNFMMLTALSLEKPMGSWHWSLRSGDCVLQVRFSQVSFFADN